MAKTAKKIGSAGSAPKKKRPSLRIRARQTWQRVAVRTPKNPHHSFRLTRPRLYLTTDDLKATWRLQVESWSFIRQHKKILLGLGLLYAVVAYFLLGGISQLV